MGESVEELRFRAVGDDAGAGRLFDKLGDKAGKAGDKVGGLTHEAKSLDDQIGETRSHLKGLIQEFERTGDVSLFRPIRKDKATLGLLTSMRKELGEVGDEAAKEARKVGTQAGQQVTSGFSDALQALPAQGRGALIIGLTALAVGSSPIIGSVIAGAVLGGVGTGGIIGGIALAAQDPAVQTAAKGVGERFLSGLTGEAGVFQGPVLESLHILERAGNTFTGTLGQGFRQLAPLVLPLALGVEGLVRNIGPGLSRAIEASKPAVRLIATELPKVGSAVSDALSDIADESDGATEGLAALFAIFEVGIRFGGGLVATLAGVFEWLVRAEGATLDFLSNIPLFGAIAPALDEGAKGAQNLEQQVNDAKASGETFVGTLADMVRGLNTTTSATDDLRKSMVDYVKSEQDAFDPMANLVHRLEDLKQAHQDYDKALHDHGRNSDEARAANLKLAEAILAANGAAAAAQGTFDGTLDPALKRMLAAGGMSKDEIRQLEQSLRDAKKAADALDGTYRVKVILEQQQTHREEARQYRASGGPVMSGKTYLVGEHGPELATFGPNGYVHDAATTRQLMSGASGGSSGSWPAGPLPVEITVKPDPGLSGPAHDIVAALIGMIQFEVGTAGGGDVNYLAGVRG